MTGFLRRTTQKGFNLNIFYGLTILIFDIKPTEANRSYPNLSHSVLGNTLQLPAKLHARLKSFALKTIDARPCDKIIGENPDDPYMLRWHIIPRNPFFNIYLHYFLHSDDDRALHDHPWINASILIKGQYVEHTPTGKFLRREGFVYMRRAKQAHRVQLMGTFSAKKEIPCTTLFITGPRIRTWGFYCPNGWRKFKDYLAENTGPKKKHSYTGRGCD